jgi:predicted acyl esterase
VLTRSWKTSERRYRVVGQKDFAIPVSDGIKLNSYLYRPDAQGRFPVILGVCAYSLDDQVAPVMPVGTVGIRGHMEAGDPT